MQARTIQNILKKKTKNSADWQPDFDCWLLMKENAKAAEEMLNSSWAY